ncbi:hypothetical protein I546_4171 [Mycobacterium kansasii 732]|nr:hypothetical protein I546_4171 [Mycobacterium kansasii 732]
MYPKPSRRAVTLQIGSLRYELSAAEALALADSLVDAVEKLRTNSTKGSATR